MYPFIRAALVVRRAKRRSALGPDDASELPMIVWPWDCDMFREMNNGRHLTLFDLGRFDYAGRTGLLKVLERKGWGLVVGGATIRYRKRLRPFQRYTLRTRLAGRDDRWFYFVQTTWRNGEACSSALVRAAVTRDAGLAPTQDVSEALGFPEWRPELSGWIRAWAEADAQRPWPPEE